MVTGGEVQTEITSESAIIPIGAPSGVVVGGDGDKQYGTKLSDHEDAYFVGFNLCRDKNTHLFYPAKLLGKAGNGDGFCSGGIARIGLVWSDGQLIAIMDTSPWVITCYGF